MCWKVETKHCEHCEKRVRCFMTLMDLESKRLLWTFGKGIWHGPTSLNNVCAVCLSKSNGEEKESMMNLFVFHFTGAHWTFWCNFHWGFWFRIDTFPVLCVYQTTLTSKTPRPKAHFSTRRDSKHYFRATFPWQLSQLHTTCQTSSGFKSGIATGDEASQGWRRGTTSFHKLQLGSPRNDAFLMLPFASCCCRMKKINENTWNHRKKLQQLSRAWKVNQLSYLRVSMVPSPSWISSCHILEKNTQRGHSRRIDLVYQNFW